MSHEQSLLARKLHLALNSVEAKMVTTGLPKQTIVEAILRELAGYVIVAAAPLMQTQRALVNDEPFEAYHQLRAAADPYMTIAHGNDGNHWADWEAAERAQPPVQCLEPRRLVPRFPPQPLPESTPCECAARMSDASHYVPPIRCLRPDGCTARINNNP